MLDLGLPGRSGLEMLSARRKVAPDCLVLILSAFDKVDDRVQGRLLARDIWRDVGRTTPLNNVIDVHIARLRRKIDSPNLVRLIRWIRRLTIALRS